MGIPHIVLPRSVVVLLAFLVAVAGAGVAGSTIGPGAGASAGTLSLLAAGTLTPQFPELASELARETPGVSSPSAAQLYTGSLSVVDQIALLGGAADLAAVADFRLVPSVLEPGAAGYEVVFASTPEVLAYDPGLGAFQGVNSSNWGAKLLAATTGSQGAPLAVWNASIDPNGYNEIFSLELQGLLYGGNLTSIYGRFYSGAPGGFARPNPSTTYVAVESQAAELLATGSVSALLTYRSYAVSHHLAYVAFDPIVGLEATSAAALADYAGLSTAIVNAAGGLSVVRAAPILFAATVPIDAPNASLGVAFLHLLLSSQGSALLAAGGGFDPIVPAWTDQPSAVPSEIAPELVPMPAWAEAYLS